MVPAIDHIMIQEGSRLTEWRPTSSQHSK